MIKRLSTEKQRQIIRESKKFKGKGKNLSNLSRQELDELVVILAKKAGIL